MGRSSSSARMRVDGPLSAQLSMKCSSQDVRIETERLILRGFEIGDFDDYHALSSDSETFRFSERGPLSSDETWSRMLRHVGHWALMKYGLLTIEEKESGRFVGETGLGDFRRQLRPDFDSAPEASWSVASWARGQGFATEASRAAIGWLEQQTGVERTVCLIHRDNAQSLSVARKLGYIVYDELIYRGYPALLHQRIASMPSAPGQEP